MLGLFSWICWFSVRCSVIARISSAQTLCVCISGLVISLIGAAQLGGAQANWKKCNEVNGNKNTYFFQSFSFKTLSILHTRLKSSPFSHLTLLPTPHTSISPILPRHTPDVSKRKPDRNLRAILRRFGRAADQEAHVCIHPAGTACVDH